MIAYGTVDVDGATRDCHVTEEQPERAGFGAAALSLASSFHFQPAQRGGHPVESQVRISMRRTGLGVAEKPANQRKRHTLRNEE